MRAADESHKHNVEEKTHTQKGKMDSVAVARKMQLCAIKATDLCRLIKVAVR